MFDRFPAGIIDPETKIRCDLIVAGASCVEPTGGWADQLAEPVLDGHMDVFELDAFWNAVPLELLGDLVEPAQDRGRILV